MNITRISIVPFRSIKPVDFCPRSCHVRFGESSCGNLTDALLRTQSALNVQEKVSFA